MEEWTNEEHEMANYIIQCRREYAYTNYLWENIAFLFIFYYDLKNLLISVNYWQIDWIFISFPNIFLIQFVLSIGTRKNWKFQMILDIRQVAPTF